MACQDPPSALPSSASPDGGLSAEQRAARLADAQQLMPVFLAVDFPTIYQTFLLYGLTTIERNEVWSRFYKLRWVHWTGELVKVSRDAMLFRQIGATSTYDVLVRVPRISDDLRRNLTVGRHYSYVGRLESFDDTFRTIYMEYGQVFDAGPTGVPGVLSIAPQMARKFPPPPTTYPGPPGLQLTALPAK